MTHFAPPFPCNGRGPRGGGAGRLGCARNGRDRTGRHSNRDDAALEAAAPSGRWLERALFLTFVLAWRRDVEHGAPAAARHSRWPQRRCCRAMAYVAEYPGSGGWAGCPGELSALSDASGGRGTAVDQVGATPIRPSSPSSSPSAVASRPRGPDSWITRGIALAQAGDLAAYRPFEQDVFLAIAAGGGLGYLLAAIFWSLALARTSAWTPWLTVYSIVLWALFALLAFGPAVVPVALRPTPVIVAAGNALAFVFCCIWLAAVTRTRAALHARYSSGRSMHPGAFRIVVPGRLCLKCWRIVAFVRAYCDCCRCQPSERHHQRDLRELHCRGVSPGAAVAAGIRVAADWARRALCDVLLPHLSSRSFWSARARSPASVAALAAGHQLAHLCPRLHSETRRRFLHFDRNQQSRLCAGRTAPHRGSADAPATSRQALSHA